MNVLAFDYGTRWIGVAIGNRLSGARALSTIGHGDRSAPWPEIGKLIAEWRPEALVVGLPLGLDGDEQPMTRAARAFADGLAERFEIPVHTVDERYSSQEASRRFASRRAAGAARRKDSVTLDAIAAQVILESWLADSADKTPS